jgi:Protein of unknown function (DUF5818)
MRVMYRFLAAAVLLIGLIATQSASADDTFRGCLAGTKDNYVLRSVDGNLYRLHSDDTIKNHVGEFIEVKGHVKNKDRDKEALRESRVNQDAGVTVPTVGIDVSHIKTLSNTCADMPNRTAALSNAPETGVSSAVADGVSGGVASGVATDESGKYQHYTGCLSGTHDNYFLRADDGNMYRLHSDKDINEHVGERVDVRGRVDNHKRDQDAQATAAATGVSTEAAGINVEDIKTISKGCINP